MKEKKGITGKPSIDRPWMRYYPDMMLQMIKMPECPLGQYLENCSPGDDVAAIEYYGREITWRTIFEDADKAARSLRALGFGEGDQIPVYLRLVPEFFSLLIAAEKIGASLLCRDNTVEENVEAARKAKAKAIIAHDFMSKEEMKEFIKNSGVEKIVLLDPLHSGDRDAMPAYVRECLNSYYPAVRASGAPTMTWDEFIELGRTYTGEIQAPEDINRPLFRAYTSGSTGPSKQVIHSSHTMLGIVCQMNFYGGVESGRARWLVTCLPPALVAVVVSMCLVPLSSDKLLILDPFCDPEDVDLELMRYKPNTWPLIPMFIERVVHSDRIPDDYDLSHLQSAGAGCEAYNNIQIENAERFLKAHNCNIRFTLGYGSSEAGSNASMPMDPKPNRDENVGIPMPLSVMSVFKPGTQEELTYYEIGEICKTGPGNMLGYDDPKETAKALRCHNDGKVWLHTGDLGYMEDDGVIHVLNRGHAPRYGGGDLAVLPMENLVADARIKGIKDEFFVLIDDEEHKGCFLPYLFVILEDGYTVESIREDVDRCLEEYMRPVDIIQIDTRPFFHYKTDRIGLTRKLKARKVS